MATSGTTGLTNIDVATLIEHIVRRCGVTPDKLTPEIVKTVKNVMFMYLTTLSNMGINLWRVQRGLFGLNEGQATYVLPSGTLDVLHVMYRRPTKLNGIVTSSAGGTVANLTDSDPDTTFVQSSTGGNVQWEFSAGTMVTLVGLLAAASETNTLIFETSDDAITWATARVPGVTSFTDGRWRWWNIEPAKKASFFRIRESSTGTLKFREAFVCGEFSEILLYRMNRDDYVGIPNKRSPGEPKQYWYDRQTSGQIIFWPTPDAGAIFNCISLYSHMQVQDIGGIANTLDIPQRWYDAFVANCAFMALLDIPGADINRYAILKDQAAMTLRMAEAEERDASPTNWTPNIGAYNA